MQVVGVAQQRLRLPFQALQSLQHCRLSTDVVRMRVELRVRHDQHVGLGKHQQGTQVSQQVSPGWRTIAICRQRERVEAAERANIGHVGFT